MSDLQFKKTTSPKKEAIKNLQVEVKNLGMATRINQMIMQKTMEQFTKMNADIQNSINMLNDLQYRTLAMLELLNINTNALDGIADKLKLKDYDTASNKEDIEKNYTSVDVVEPDSIVIIASDAPDDKGIFRSKFKLSDCGHPEMQAALNGKHIGDKVNVKLNDLDHEVEVIAIRKEPAPAAETATPTTPDLKVVATAEPVASAVN